MRLTARISTAVLLVALFATAVFAQDEHAREEEFLIRGLIRDGLYEVAADRINSFIHNYPEHSRRRSMVEDIVGKLINKGSIEAAVPLMRAYREFWPTGNQFKTMTYYLAEELYKKGEYLEAGPLLEEIIATRGYKNSSTQQARNMLARIWLGNGENGAVISLVEDVPQSQIAEELLLIYAEALLGFGEEGTAEEVLTSLAARRRLDAAIRSRSLALLGDLFIRQNRWEEAVSALEGYSFSEDAPLSDDERTIALSLGVGLYHLERYEEAWRAVQPIWNAKEPANTSGQMPVVFMALNEFDAAAGILKTSFEKAANNREKIQTGESLVFASIRSGDRETAANTLKAMAQAAASSARRVRFLLRAEALNDDVEERIRILREATIWDAPDGLRCEAYYRLGEILYQTGEIAEAAVQWLKAKELRVLSPFADLAMLRLARAEISAGRPGAAFKELQDLLARKPALDIQEEALLLGIQIAAQLGEWAEAENYLGQLQLSVPGAKIPSSVWQAGVRAALGLEKPELAALRFEHLYVSDSSETEVAEFHPLLAEARQLIAAGDYKKGTALLSALENSDAASLVAAARFALAKAAYEHEEPEAAYEIALTLSAESAGRIGTDAALLAAQAAGSAGNIGEQVRILQDIVSNSDSAAAKTQAVGSLQEIAVGAGNYNGALQVNPQFSEFRPDSLYAVERRLGEAARRYSSGDHEGARAIYEQLPKGIELKPLQRIYYSSALYHTGETDSAASLIENLEPKDIPQRMRWERDRILAAGLVLEAKYDEAFAVIHELLQQPLPDDMRTELQLEGANVANLADFWTQADELYRAYLDEARGDIDVAVLDKIAQVFIDHENYQTAIELYRRMQLRADGAEAVVKLNFRIAELMEFKDGPGAAAEEFLNIAYRYPDLGAWPAKARLRAAEQFEKAGQKEIAMRQYRQVAERYAGTDEAQTAATRLRALEQEQSRIQEEQLRPPGN